INPDERPGRAGHPVTPGCQPDRADGVGHGELRVPAGRRVELMDDLAMDIDKREACAFRVPDRTFAELCFDGKDEVRCQVADGHDALPGCATTSSVRKRLRPLYATCWPRRAGT